MARSLIGQDSTARRKPMNTGTKDEIKGTLHEVKGKIKEKAGQITNRPDLETEGKSEHIAGKVEKKIGQIEKVIEKQLRRGLSGACSCIRNNCCTAVPRSIRQRFDGRSILTSFSKSRV